MPVALSPMSGCSAEDGIDMKDFGGQFPVLLVDDEQDALEMTRKVLLDAGISTVYTMNDSRAVIPFMETHQVSLIVLDLVIPHLSGSELLQILRRDYPQVPVIIETASYDLDTAVTSMRAGAFDYLVKPVDVNRLLASVKNALNYDHLRQEVIQLKDYLLNNRLAHAEVFADIKTNNGKMRSIFQYAEVVARSPQPVLITGETGVGKELFARAIHRLSGLKGDFVSVNAAGLDDTMFTDTIFGHKKGAFTGADQARDGLVQRASGGTLFLDEIGDLKELSQVKLLRLLQENEYYPVGSDTLKTSTARLVLATNVDLEARIRGGRFRRDLYFRLCTHLIDIPPLRERADDIPLLVHTFIEMSARQLKKNVATPTAELLDALKAHPFPGNVRELNAMVCDAMTRYTDGPLTLHHFPGVAPRPVTSLPVLNPEAGVECLYMIFGHLPTFREVEDFLIKEALKISGGSLPLAASMLGVTRQTISNRMKAAD